MEAEDILKDYELDLEDLTFNSKPIINTLTMKAEKHKELAPRLVELIQTRFFKVATRTPCCYVIISYTSLINSQKWFCLFIKHVLSNNHKIIMPHSFCVSLRIFLSRPLVSRKLSVIV